jgi:predicted lipid-binding transport protein (Tim44 family)
MLNTWLRKLGTARLVALTVLGLLVGSALLAPPAEARFGRSRGGGFSSFGSRGSRSGGTGGGLFQPSRPSNGGGFFGGTRTNTGVSNNRGSWLQRNPLLGGLLGGIAGTVIGGMLLNAFGAGGGMGGLLMLLVVGGVIFMIMSALRNRRQPVPVGYGGNAPPAYGSQTAFGNDPYSSPRSAGWDVRTDDENGSFVNTQTREQGMAAMSIEDPSMTQERLQDLLSARFFEIQEAWTNADRATLRNASTAETYEEFISDLDAMERRGERNVLKNIVIRSFDVTEVWQEGDVEYATAHIQARLLDYVERNGQIISGDKVNPINFGEYWTFVRTRGRGEWKLTAVNQEA